MDPKKVFISYSHDSPAHVQRVEGLAASLRRDGVDCQIDQYRKGNPPEGWPVWMEETIEWAEFVLIVCTETYNRRVRRKRPPGEGLGVIWEAHLIYMHLYEARMFSGKFIPVIFDGADKEFIPLPLRGAGHYLLDTQQGYDRLYVTITGQHQPPPEIGSVKSTGRPPAPPSFAEPGREAVEAVQAALKKPRLRGLGDSSPPTDPYPLLLPYKHQDLFAGREREIEELRRLLSDTIQVVGLYSTSGAGKSSLLHAGLTPSLLKSGWPVAYTAYPKERDLARRLVEGMLDWEGGKEVCDDDPATFREAVRTAHALSGHPAILILDQFEDLVSALDDRAKECVGRLLTATVEEKPFCRWVLSYRHEYHGRVEEWLQDLFRRADLTTRGRFRTYPLKPLGDAESIEDSRSAFLSAITAPLKAKDGKGNPLYRLSFSEGSAERLAAAFAKARGEHPRSPLLPDLQVVLAHLIKESGGDEIRVPEKPEERIKGALTEHLRRAIEDVAGDPAGRAEVLLALRDLATDEGKRHQGRTTQELEDALDAEIVRKLCDDHRILYRETREGRDCTVLSHDRIAEAIVKEMEDPRIREWLDTDLISLRRLVTSKAALLNYDPVEATRLSPENFRRIKTHAKAVLWDQARKDWWSACVRQNCTRIESLKADFSSPDQPDRALERLGDLSELGLGRRELADLLRDHSNLKGIFEDGARQVSEERRNTVLALAADCCLQFLPERIRKDFDSCVPALGVLLWTLDGGPLRDREPAVMERAREVRRLLVQSLHEHASSLPRLGEDDWAFIPGGRFRMGSETGRADESPVHTVEVGSFRLLRHAVTNSEFATLFGGRWATEAIAEPRHPAVWMDWYQAYVFAAWLGGRLPTEAEWEFAARSGGKNRRYPWGDGIHKIRRRAVVKSHWRPRFLSGPRPVCSIAGGNTDQGVCDMAGNVWEWVADWYHAYTDDDQIDPWGPISMTTGGRVTRGGSFDDPMFKATVSARGGWFATAGDFDLGFRVALPVPPSPVPSDS